MRGFLRWMGALAIAGALLACGSGDDSGKPAAPGTAPAPAAAPAPAPAPAAASSEAVGDEAKKIFETRCYTCHGMTGMGDGPGSAALTPKPRNFHDKEWQASVNDDHINKIILYGGAAVGRSPMMPGNPDLIAKPEVVKGLVAHIRELGEED